MAAWWDRFEPTQERGRRRWSLWAAAAAGAVVLLAVGIWLGSLAGYRLYEAEVKHGCLRLPSDVESIRLAQGSAGHVRFAALGDTGTGSEGARRVAAALRSVCGQEGCDFVAFLGDNFYPDGVKSLDDPLFQSAFESVYGGLQLPVLATLGNHDTHTNPIFQVLYSLRSRQWHMPNFEYRYHLGPVRFFAVNTNCQPLTWWHLKPGLEQAWDGWTFVLGHFSIYSSGPHGDSNWIQRWYWSGVQPRVDFYVSGYNHVLEHYQRPGETTDYIVSGSSGEQDNKDTGRKGVSMAEQRFLSTKTGFAWFDVTADAVTVRFYDDTGTRLYEYRRERGTR